MKLIEKKKERNGLITLFVIITCLAAMNKKKFTVKKNHTVDRVQPIIVAVRNGRGEKLFKVYSRFFLFIFFSSHCILMYVQGALTGCKMFKYIFFFFL